MFENKIPKVSPDIEILPFDNGGFLVHHKVLNHRLNINTLTKQLLSLVDGKKNISQLTKELKEKHSVTVDEEKIYDIIFNRLGKFHIIENTEFEYKQKEKPSYLKLSFVILKKDWIDDIVTKLGFLFSKKVFYTIFFSTLIFMAVIIILNYKMMLSGLEDLTISNGILYFILFAIVIVFHEFGHAAACSKYGAKHGDIGFGFYLLSPVMFADVSDAWKLKRSERIIVNLGGIYMQLIIASLFSIVYLFTKNKYLLIPAYTIGGLSVFYNLNPFFRTDGYWILSDYTGIANLRENSNIVLQKLSANIFKRNAIEFSTKNILLAFYALASVLFIVFFLFTILINNPNSILNYPFDLVENISYIFKNRKLDIEKLQLLILPTIFFTLLLLFSIKIFKTKVMTLPKNKKKEILIIAAKILLATIFLLSAVGKTLDFDLFTQKIEKFNFIALPYVPHLLLLIEYLIAIGFILFIYTKKIAKFTIGFVALLTVAYSIGYFYLDIKECDCFGFFDILTPKTYIGFLLKNILIIALSYFVVGYKNSFEKKIRKSIVSLLLMFALSFMIYLAEVKSISNFAFTNAGKSISELSLTNPNDLKSYKYWFVFSPNCPHCLKALPKVENLVNDRKISLVAITREKNKEETEKLHIKMPLKYLDKKSISNLTRIVPILFEVKNDTISDVYHVKEFLDKRK